jgi:hypothetical protein
MRKGGGAHLERLVSISEQLVAHKKLPWPDVSNRDEGDKTKCLEALDKSLGEPLARRTELEKKPSAV